MLICLHQSDTKSHYSILGVTFTAFSKNRTTYLCFPEKFLPLREIFNAQVIIFDGPSENNNYAYNYTYISDLRKIVDTTLMSQA